MTLLTVDFKPRLYTPMPDYLITSEVLTPYDKLVWLIVASECGYNGFTIYRSTTQELADAYHMKIDCIQKSINKLIKYKLLVRHRSYRYTDETEKTNRCRTGLFIRVALPRTAVIALKPRVYCGRMYKYTDKIPNRDNIELRQLWGNNNKKGFWKAEAMSLQKAGYSFALMPLWATSLGLAPSVVLVFAEQLMTYGGFKDKSGDDVCQHRCCNYESAAKVGNKLGLARSTVTRAFQEMKVRGIMVALEKKPPNVERDKVGRRGYRIYMHHYDPEYTEGKPAVIPKIYAPLGKKYIEFIGDHDYLADECTLRFYINGEVKRRSLKTIIASFFSYEKSHSVELMLAPFKTRARDKSKKPPYVVVDIPSHYDEYYEESDDDDE